MWDIVEFLHASRTSSCRAAAARRTARSAIASASPRAIRSRDNLLFERFLSEGRTSWPDIDLDLPSGDRRESVIQEVYRRYGKHGAAMTANVITYRGRSAMREIGKVLNFPDDVLDRFSRLSPTAIFRTRSISKRSCSKPGIPPEHPRTAARSALYQQIYGLPRHLGQHTGGMIICQGQLDSIVPLENARMPGRVVAQWDKDDCEDSGIIKVDLLGLGMMAVMQDTLEICAAARTPVDLAQIPKDDPATYDDAARRHDRRFPDREPRADGDAAADEAGEFYDVVMEVAIIRPGPIQGDMMHPYLARRAGKGAGDYYRSSDLKPVLERTLGVPFSRSRC